MPSPEDYKKITAQAQRVADQIVANRETGATPPRRLMLDIFDLMVDLVGAIAVIKQLKKEIKELKEQASDKIRLSTHY